MKRVGGLLKKRLMGKKWLLVFSFTWWMVLGVSAYAVKPGEELADPAQEARARQLSAHLRCLVCQNQSIDDSDAALAGDLRLLVRERILAGQDDQAVMDYIVARYGDFVLLKPRFSSQNLLLWGLPIFALFGGVGLAARVFKRKNAAKTRRDSPDDAAFLDENEVFPLSEQENQRLETILMKPSSPR